MPARYLEAQLLTHDEQKIIVLKYKSKQIWQMSDAEIGDWSRALLLKIHVITGWVIPSDDALLVIMVDQFQKHLTEQFSELNPDEIEFAFRSTGTTIEDYGKSMNLNLIDKVLLPYLHKRYEVSNHEERVSIQKLTAENWDARTHIDWRGQIENNYQHFLYGSPFFVRHPHPFEYDQLEADGFIQKGAYREKLKVYQKRVLMNDVDMAKRAKANTVMKLFRVARKMQYQHIYVR